MDRVKVDRRCPRCHVRAYHWGNDNGVPHCIRCANCGHVWTGRIRNDEQKNVYREGWEPPLGVALPVHVTDEEVFAALQRHHLRLDSAQARIDMRRTLEGFLADRARTASGVALGAKAEPQEQPADSLWNECAEAVGRLTSQAQGLKPREWGRMSDLDELMQLVDNAVHSPARCYTKAVRRAIRDAAAALAGGVTASDCQTKPPTSTHG